MKRLRWILVGGTLAAGGLAAWLAGSCAIDDEVTWISGPQCTGDCLTADPGSLACDTDSTCTIVAGCTDWDCSEMESPVDGADADGGEPDGDRDIDGDASGTVDGDDAPPVAYECAPLGGGPDRGHPTPITLGVPVSGLLACPATSQWFGFDAAVGARFAIDLQPVEVGRLTFLLYAGDDPTPVASADMDATGSFAAMAGANTTYYLRVRASGETAVPYVLTVAEAAP
jgi:hypothetical protein